MPMPTATNSAVATNVSMERVSATTSNTRRSKTLPAAITRPKPAADLRRIVTTAAASCPDSTSGTTTSNGATKRSCKRRIAQLATPKRPSSHPFAFKTGKTKALEESAPTQPTMNALSPVGLRPATPMVATSPAIATVVTITCPRPIVAASLASWLNRSNGNSSPSLNSKKRIPKSPSSTSIDELPSKPSPAGPMRTPTAMNPKIGII
mmetsp:Transcript_36727/g.72684  ORF Transcript_36727/g.72684 Transcript_36727/m.72684 type:complete len:208 (-) Transcript_36727:31-654(-)